MTSQNDPLAAGSTGIATGATTESTASAVSSSTTNRRHLQIVNSFAYGLNVAITFGIGVGGILNLPTNGDLSQKYQTLVTPAGWAFSIWGLIFLMQGIWVFYFQIFAKTELSTSVSLVGYNYLYIVLLQCAWTLSFSNEIIWLSVVVMMGLCGALWTTTLRLFNGRSDSDSSFNYWLEIFPFTLHTGWITAATLVNINVFLVAASAPVTAQFIAAIASLLVLLTVSRLCTDVDATILVVIAWALNGIFFELASLSYDDYNEWDENDESILGSFSERQIKIAKYGSLLLALDTVLRVIIQKYHQYWRNRSDAPSSTPSDYFPSN